VDEASRTVVVRIHPGSDPVCGTIQGPGEPAVRFVGYVQLVAQLERLRDAEVEKQDRVAPADDA
jgi:hypothetical protein